MMSARTTRAAAQVRKVLVVCDREDTASVWQYVLREHSLITLQERSTRRAVERWAVEMPELLVIDLAPPHRERMQLCRRFRQVSTAPILMLLPVYHEVEILEAYAAGVDEVIVKPVSPAVFAAKVRALQRRSGTTASSLSHVQAGRHRLELARRALISPRGSPVRLTNLEFRLLHLLMSRPGHVFEAEEIIEALWGGFDGEGQVLLKNVVYRLRRKIETDPGQPVLLRTEPGGYSFQG